MDEFDNMRKDMIDTGQPETDLKAAREDKQQTWTTEQLQQDYHVTAFVAPFVEVVRKSDGVIGTLEFTGRPRVYFGFVVDVP